LDAGGRAQFVPCDARVQPEVEALIDSAVGRHGRVDILVNNAGGSDRFALVHELSDEAWRNAFDFILNSAFWATRRALPSMLDHGWGRIINISSVEGKLGNKAAVSHYITAKHALNGFTKAVAFEYGAKGITCNAICPGAVETDLMMDVGPKYAAEHGISYDDYKKTYADESSIKRQHGRGGGRHGDPSREPCRRRHQRCADQRPRRHCALLTLIHLNRSPDPLPLTGGLVDGRGCDGQ
jgi:3-hydroxybutyrate dehydrogenase